MPTRCQRGEIRDKKTNTCVKRNDLAVGTRRRCPRGSRRNRKTNTCVPNKFPSYVPLSSSAKEVSSEISTPMSSRAYNNEKMMREIDKMEGNLDKAIKKGKNLHGYSSPKSRKNSKKKWSKPKSNSAESFNTGNQRKMRELLAKMEEGLNRADKIAKKKY